jgi:hypothetical protein
MSSNQFHPTPSHPVPSHPIPSHPVPAHPAPLLPVQPYLFGPQHPDYASASNHAARGASINVGGENDMVGATNPMDDYSDGDDCPGARVSNPTRVKKNVFTDIIQSGVTSSEQPRENQEISSDEEQQVAAQYLNFLPPDTIDPSLLAEECHLQRRVDDPAITVSISLLGARSLTSFF